MDRSTCSHAQGYLRLGSGHGRMWQLKNADKIMGCRCKKSRGLKRALWQLWCGRGHCDNYGQTEG
eukprot:1142707-Pelagomonas_calceolata.AAC.12